ncbi:hypothetical protein LZQ00_01585 [Sphingobacterium sp. SRCM116780]|uniref:hypothetical protein n=1 Tax=Sphingobacterium sp. SRCM116780 TaxID=2907623 RepID=UPI001F45C053|nr:hypothetical protein [Sphingobacterium sp. SRCM116780]UIR56525.1 hypothetical protein LZQ00_01585 [Sphingobacterium sp. SRCM116780]
MKQTLLSFLVGGMILSSVTFAQEKKISGRVTSATGQAVPGVKQNNINFALSSDFLLTSSTLLPSFHHFFTIVDSGKRRCNSGKIVVQM